MSLAVAVPKHGLWHFVWMLLHLQWRIFVSGFRHAKRGRKLGYLLLGALLLLAAVGVFVISLAILTALRSPQLAAMMDPAPLIAIVPALVETAVFMAVLLFSFGVLLQGLYLSGDMDFLLSAPVPIRAVFVAKLLQAVLPALAFTLLFGMPVLYGLGAAGGYSLSYYPTVTIILVVTALAGASLSSLLVMSVVRVVPARRVAEMLGLVGGLTSLFCSQSNLLVRSVPSSQQVSQAFGALAGLSAPWSPMTWAGRALVDIGEGHWPSGIGLTLLTLGLAGVVLAVALTTAERLYYTGWARVQVGARRNRNGRTPRPSTRRDNPFAGFVGRLIPASMRAIIGKDALVIRRDLRNISQLLTPMVLGVVYSAALITGGGALPAGRGGAPPWIMQGLNTLLGYGSIGVAIFVGFSLLIRLGMMGFSQEGKAYWLLKTAPVSSARLLAAKYLVAYVPTLILSWAFLLIPTFLQRGGISLLPFGLLVLALCIAGGAGIALAIGVAGANLDWDDPRRMVSATTGCLGPLVCAFYMFVSLALFLGPPIVSGPLGWSETLGRLIGLGLGGALSLACATIPIWVVRDRVPRIGNV
jgi:ABC-2 type transport system permease protein